MRAILTREPGDETVLDVGDVPVPGARRRPTSASACARPPSTAPTCCSGRASIRRRPGPRRSSASSAPARCIELGAGRPRLHAAASASWRSFRAAATRRKRSSHHGSVLPVPDGMSDEEAGAFPEVVPHRLLEPLHAGASARSRRARRRSSTAAAAASARRRSGSCAKPGIRVLRHRRQRREVPALRRARRDGGDQLPDGGLRRAGARAHRRAAASTSSSTTSARAISRRTWRALASGGRLVEIGLMGGAHGEINLGELLIRAARRHRLDAAHAGRSTRRRAIVAALRASASARALAAGRLRPVVDRVLPLAQAADAHRLMQASEHFGKIVLAQSHRRKETRMADAPDFLARGREVAGKLWGARAGGQELPAQKLAPEFFAPGDAVRLRHVLVAPEPRPAEPEPLHRRAARRARQDRRAEGRTSSARSTSASRARS